MARSRRRSRQSATARIARSSRRPPESSQQRHRKYTIDVLDDQGPSVSFNRPGRDTSVSSIEEVFVEAAAEDDFGVRNLEAVTGERWT